MTLLLEHAGHLNHRRLARADGCQPLHRMQIDAALEDGAPCPFWRIEGCLWGPDDTAVMHVDWRLRHKPQEDALKQALWEMFERQTGREPEQYGIEVTEEFDPRDWR